MSIDVRGGAQFHRINKNIFQARAHYTLSELPPFDLKGRIGAFVEAEAPSGDGRLAGERAKVSLRSGGGSVFQL